MRVGLVGTPAIAPPRTAGAIATSSTHLILGARAAVGLQHKLQEVRSAPPVDQAPLKAAERPSPTVSRTEVPTA